MVGINGAKDSLVLLILRVLLRRLGSAFILTLEAAGVVSPRKLVILERILLFNSKHGNCVADMNHENEPVEVLFKSIFRVFLKSGTVI